MGEELVERTDLKIERKVQDAGHLIGVLWIDGAFQGTLVSSQEQLGQVALPEQEEIGEDKSVQDSGCSTQTCFDFIEVVIKKTQSVYNHPCGQYYYLTTANTPYLAIQRLPLVTGLLAGKGSMRG